MAEIKKFLDSTGVGVIWEQLAAELEGKADAATLQTLQQAVNTLNGEKTVDGSVAKKVADAIAEVVAGADASYDTLKEIADWIIAHPDNSAAMNSAIQKLQTLVGDALPEDKDTATNVIEYVGVKASAAQTAAAADATSKANTAKTEAIADAEKKIATAKTEIEAELPTALSREEILLAIGKGD